MQIRDARVSDYTELEALRSRGGLTGESLTAFVERLGRPDFLYRVLEQSPGNRIVGFYSARFLPPEGELLEIAVAPSCRRRGLGELLLCDFLAVGRSHGCRRLFLEVGVDNGAARSLYEKVGFRVCGRRPAYYRANPSRATDALVMALELPEEEAVRT